MMMYVEFTGEESEKEFLEKCLEQWAYSTSYPPMQSMIQLGAMFAEMRHRVVDDFEPTSRKLSETKISACFAEFLDSEENGMEDIISELNSKVAQGSTKNEIALEECGKEYFLECMKLAINVIISFENEEDDGE